MGEKVRAETESLLVHFSTLVGTVATCSHAAHSARPRVEGLLCQGTRGGQHSSVKWTRSDAFYLSQRPPHRQRACIGCSAQLQAVGYGGKTAFHALWDKHKFSFMLASLSRYIGYIADAGLTTLMLTAGLLDLLPLRGSWAPSEASASSNSRNHTCCSDDKGSAGWSSRACSMVSK